MSTPGKAHDCSGLSRTRELLIGRLRRRKSREREGLFLAEGVRCSLAVLAAGGKVRFALCSPRLGTRPDGAELAARLQRAKIETLQVDDRQLGLIADTDAPQGVLLVCQQVQVELGALDRAGTSRLLIADAIQDPGNLGALIRSAAALGLNAVIALDGCVDPWNPKAVRASAGAICRLPVVMGRWKQTAAWLERTSTPLLVAGAGGETPDAVDLNRWALVIGNEGSGPRDAILQDADTIVTVPLSPRVESLNASVAGAILMYALSS